MKRFLFVTLAALAFAACGSEPERDEPRYSRSDVYAIIRDRRLQTESAIERATDCDRSLVIYGGDGIWYCEKWRFDEQTGQLFTVRQ